MNPRSRKKRWWSTKKKKFAETFSRFPESKLNLIKVDTGFPIDEKDLATNHLIIDDDLPKGLTKDKPTRWEWIKENIPDFDIYIDDDPSKIIKARELFVNQPEKIYLMPQL